MNSPGQVGSPLPTRVIVSPHFDDGVLSASSLLADRRRSVLLTVFGGGPASIRPITTWDKACGFNEGDDVVTARTQEDASACGVFDAYPVPLPHWDSQYRSAAYGYSGVSEAELAQQIAQSLHDVFTDHVSTMARGITEWCVPLGIGHQDHMLTAEGVRIWASQRNDLTVTVFEDLPYAARSVGLRDQALRRWEDFGWSLGPRDVVDTTPLKQMAADFYASQNGGLGVDLQLAVDTPETYYSASYGSGDLSRA